MRGGAGACTEYAVASNGWIREIGATVVVVVVVDVVVVVVFTVLWLAVLALLGRRVDDAVEGRRWAGGGAGAADDDAGLGDWERERASRLGGVPAAHGEVMDECTSLRSRGWGGRGGDGTDARRVGDHARALC